MTAWVMSPADARAIRPRGLGEQGRLDRWPTQVVDRAADDLGVVAKVPDAAVAGRAQKTSDPARGVAVVDEQPPAVDVAYRAAADSALAALRRVKDVVLRLGETEVALERRPPVPCARGLGVCSVILPRPGRFAWSTPRLGVSVGAYAELGSWLDLSAAWAPLRPVDGASRAERVGYLRSLVGRHPFPTLRHPSILPVPYAYHCPNQIGEAS